MRVLMWLLIWLLGSAGESLLEVLKKGGRYAAAGAIAGPIVELDVRTLYLKDLVLIGCTFQDRQVFQNLIGYIERNEITAPRF
jgi:D-arabinose 1-dehydrogenase-like Zn-dependent alcohol dehydrogenase